MSLFSIFDISGSALSAQSQRLNVSASNMANVDSVVGPDGEPYRAKQVVFQVNAPAGQDIGGVHVTQVVDDPTPFVWNISQEIHLQMKKAMCVSLMSM